MEITKITVFCASWCWIQTAARPELLLCLTSGNHQRALHDHDWSFQKMTRRTARRSLLVFPSGEGEAGHLEVGPIPSSGDAASTRGQQPSALGRDGGTAGQGTARWEPSFLCSRFLQGSHPGMAPVKQPKWGQAWVGWRAEI